MKSVFKDHTVICGWNKRGPRIVKSLQALSVRPIVVLNHRVDEVIKQVGDRLNVFIVPGDPADFSALAAVDVATARSVVVLADESLGDSADARSVQIALAVERIQVSVYTVVELKDIRNKAHFSWTKVDDLITDEELSVKLMAQAIRHVVSGGERRDRPEKILLNVYHQLINPHHSKSQLYRIDCAWPALKELTFDDILKTGMDLSVLPLAVAGYQQHEIAARPGQDAWVSWKVDVRTAPLRHVRLRQMWPLWPSAEFSLGLFVIARERAQTAALKERLENLSPAEAA